MSNLPKDWIELKDVTGVFINQNTNDIIITGVPDSEDESHNCDEMLCTSVEHTIWRGNDQNRFALRHSVKWFAEQMEQTLRRNDHKGGWGDETISYLLGRLQEEVNELNDAASYSAADQERTIREATDVANFAMMIADNARRWASER